jgi:hypothetical protein
VEFVTVKFTIQLMVDTLGDDKAPAAVIERVIAAADTIPVAQLIVDSVSRIQLPAVKMAPQVR